MLKSGFFSKSFVLCLKLNGYTDCAKFPAMDILGGYEREIVNNLSTLSNQIITRKPPASCNKQYNMFVLFSFFFLREGGDVKT